MRREDEVKYWAGLARYDFGVAQTLLESKKYVYALFFAHLVIEKMLKALFVRINGATPPPTHNLLRRDVRKVRKISTKKFTEQTLGQVMQWRKRLTAEIGKKRKSSD